MYRAVAIAKDTAQGQNKALALSFFLVLFFKPVTYCESLNGSPFEPQQDVFQRFLMLRTLTTVCFSTVEELNAFLHGLRLLFDMETKSRLGPSSLLCGPFAYLLAQKVVLPSLCQFPGIKQDMIHEEGIQTWIKCYLKTRRMTIFAAGMWTSRRLHLLWADEYNMLFLIEATSSLAFIVAVSEAWDSLKKYLDNRQGYNFFSY